MLKSVVVSSANDCACALAEHVAGSEAAFVSRMNDRAAELGMTDTHFVNCTGLDDGPDADTHLTTAYDIALMSRALLQHDEIDLPPHARRRGPPCARAAHRRRLRQI